MSLELLKLMSRRWGRNSPHMVGDELLNVTTGVSACQVGSQMTTMRENKGSMKSPVYDTHCPQASLSKTNSKISKTALSSFKAGFKVLHLSSRLCGYVEFAPESSEEVLVSFNESESEDFTSLRWVVKEQLQIIDKHRQKSFERQDVRAYRDTVEAIKMHQEGETVQDIAQHLDRPLAWVKQKVSINNIAHVAKPRGLEWLDSAGFREIVYLRKYATMPGLYEDIVQNVEWEQDRVWRVRKEQDTDQWHLRTVKECPGLKGRTFCGRSLQKVPDNTHQIGPNDKRQAAQTRIHADWACQLQTSPGCLKSKFQDPAVEPYWWCQKCSWYACDVCVQQMPDKATSKQLAWWKPNACPKLDALVADLVRDFHLPDPTTFTVKMNWYPDALSRVSPHRHDNWTLLVSLGSPRVLTVDRSRILMEDGDLILFGTQSHGVPEMEMTCQGGRLSLVLMFAANEAVGKVAEARYTAGGASATRGGPQPEGLPSPPALPDFSYYLPLSADVDDFEGNLDVDQKHVSSLCDLGFSVADVVTALRVANGDVDQAASMLLAAID